MGKETSSPTPAAGWPASGRGTCGEDWVTCDGRINVLCEAGSADATSDGSSTGGLGRSSTAGSGAENPSDFCVPIATGSRRTAARLASSWRGSNARERKVSRQDVLHELSGRLDGLLDHHLTRGCEQDHSDHCYARHPSRRQYRSEPPPVGEYGPRRPVPRARPSSSRLRRWQGKPERRPLIGLTIDGDLPADALDQGVSHGQSEARAALALDPRIGTAEELGEQLRLVC